MADNNYDKSGLYSLGGFAFQIKVFFLYALQLSTKESFAEFETLDDVAIKKPADIQNKDTSYISKISNSKHVYQIVQVKKTKLNQTKIMDILLNWLIAYNTYSNIENYILFTEKSNDNKNIVNGIKIKQLYLYAINKEVKRKTSIAGRIQNLYKGDGKYKLFIEHFKSIKSKILFLGDDNIDAEIKEAAAIHFKRGAVAKEIYCARLQSALEEITVRIIEKASEGKPFLINQDEFNQISENIIHYTNEEMPIPLSYSEFASKNNIDINSYKEKREYKQLNYCGLPTTAIKRNLQYCCYYSDFRYRLLAINKHRKISDLELQSYENFEDAKSFLQVKNIDKPINRLEKTQEKQNDYTPKKELSHGSYIYLTQSNIGNNQISWKDEDE